MSAGIRHILSIAAALIFVSAPTLTAQLPQDYEPNTCKSEQSDGKPGISIKSGCGSEICPGHRSVLQELQSLSAARRIAIDSGNYTAALTCTDSMIRTVETQRLSALKYWKYYKDRAEILRLSGHMHEACAAFERAVKVQDSLAHLQQSQAMKDMQTSYELDRLALEEARLRAQGHKKTLIWVGLLILVEICVVGFIYLSNRRTKRLQAELTLRMKQAQESEQKKADFINSVCHEVRTPLNSISGFGELLCMPDLSAVVQEEYREIIMDNRRQLRYLFDDLLEVAYLEGLQEELPRRYVDICALCRSQLRVMKVRFPKPGVAYTDTIPNENIGVMANEKYVVALVAALLNNAYKFTQQGTIRIECGREGSDHIFIAITDTGIGIPLSEHEHVFERFTKLDTFSPGNGLGLYLCQLIVRHMRGHIYIDPDYTSGARFVAILPRK